MLKLINVKKSYGSTVAVDGLSFEVSRGEILALLGPNGAGKSTTVHISVGRLPPDEGEVVLDGGGDPTQPAGGLRIGVAPQILSLYEVLTAGENLRFFGTMQGLKGALLEERVTWALEFVGLADRRKDQVRSFSVGMKRRLNLAASIVHDPELILLDEPTAGVDQQSRNSILEDISRLRDNGSTVVYTTHGMEEVERLCDRVAILDRGRLLALDSVDGLIQKHGGSPLPVTEADSSETRVETEDLQSDSIAFGSTRRPGGFRVEHSSLAQVFLNLTGRHLTD